MAANKTTRSRDIDQPKPTRGQRWRHKRSGLICEISQAYFFDQNIIVADILDELGCMTWRSTERMFVERWRYVEGPP